MAGLFPESAHGWECLYNWDNTECANPKLCFVLVCHMSAELFLCYIRSSWWSYGFLCHESSALLVDIGVGSCDLCCREHHCSCMFVRLFQNVCQMESYKWNFCVKEHAGCDLILLPAGPRHHPNLHSHQRATLISFPSPNAGSDQSFSFLPI